ncbi:nucleoside diphosphate kinase regulator [Fulvimonas sp. R45]|uniref:nucleoside diphosphate kinase regulator n=1 Tax=Fulvimonas sp. R45 TaxID=3045937 RepID=UPI00266051B2|nr:nucleoside diphosphate kinase regulator [Fulvimonas sp. R45]MDO1528670.1 nucleoside diphosphate kinase regulator [Fulvimonas sp. R45]
MNAKPSIVLSRLDLQRIEALLERLPPQEADRYAALQAELDRATVVEPAAMPPDVVSMRSVVRFEDEQGGSSTVTLAYPGDAPAANAVSVLAPVGSALLGLRVGQTIDWPVPGAQRRRLRVVGIDYQPEAAGELHR